MTDVRAQGVSGRSWVVDLRWQASPGGRTTPYYGWEEGTPKHRYWVQRAIGGEEWTDDQAHLRRAYEVGQLSAVAASPRIHAPVDLIDGFDVYMISEIAGASLGEVLRHRLLGRAEVDRLERSLLAALTVLHGLGLVHSDVREDNILRVGDEWKLGDLGGVVGEGEKITVVQRDEAYRREGAALGAPAVPENDLYALRLVRAHAEHGSRRG